jgi:hypothetical protein
MNERHTFFEQDGHDAELRTPFFTVIASKTASHWHLIKVEIHVRTILVQFTSKYRAAAVFP